uniref:Uncharacterized protein n=1 Tax=Brassica oleracea TaxID=3712 RepID=A0A3P6DVY1_BRAOL|nr:unnamed protein product [Brassica oleracea]
MGKAACCHQESSPEPPHARTSSSSSSPSTAAQDEAVAADRAAIEARMSPHAPPEVSPLRAREVHAPPPEIVATAFAAGKLRLRRR